MPTLTGLTNLSEFIGQDLSRSFWNGDGNVTILAKDIVDAIRTDPDITVGALRARLTAGGRPLIVQTGLDFDIDAEDPLRLGERNSGRNGNSVNFAAHVDLDARVMVILSSDAFAGLKGQHPADLGTLLHDHTTLSGQNGLVVVAASGEADAQFSSTVLNRPGVNVGISFKAGAGVGWVVCRPVRDADKLLDAIRETFGWARLPQSDPAEILAAGRSVTLRANEILSTSFNGFMSLGGEATFGYDTSGTTKYALGAMDLATKLVLKARAKVNVGYSLAGAFKTTVLPVDTPGWVRVVVEKDRTSTFDFGIGVTVDAKLEPKGLPTEGGGLALLEAILGFHTPQIAQQVLELAALSPEDLAKKADGTIKGFVERWAGRGFDELSKTELGELFNKVVNGARQITDLEDRAVALYERYVVDELEPAFEALERILAKASIEEQRQALVEKINDERIRNLVEMLADEAFGSVVVSFERVVDELTRQARNLRDTISKDVEGLIRKFIETRIESLGLMPLVEQLKRIDTPEELRNTTAKAVVGLAERLTGDTIEKILMSPEAVKVIRELNAIANGIEQILTKFNDVVTKALNAQGRFELSDAYQRVREGQKLIDVHIHVDPPEEALRHKAHELYGSATRGKFDDVLKTDNAMLVRVSSAAFTDMLKKVGKLKVKVFGWDYKEVKTILASLEGTVKESPTGLITVYAIKVKGETIKDHRDRTATLGYLFQVVGQVKGAFEAPELRKQIIDAFENLKQAQGELNYRIADKLTTLDELQSYLSLANRLGLLDTRQTDNLLRSVDELRRPANGAPPALERGNLEGVRVSYTVGFDGEALARALTQDLTGQTIGWWGEKKGDFREPFDTLAQNHKTGVKALYAECLIRSLVLGRVQHRDDYAVASMFKTGWFVDLNDNPNAHWPTPIHTLVERRSDGEKIFVSITEQAREWARFQYLTAAAIADFLDDFRQSLEKSRRQPLEKLEQFMKALVSNLQRAGQGDQSSLPFLLLDELVRRTNPAAQDTRRALLEVALMARNKNEPIERIPIVG